LIHLTAKERGGVRVRGKRREGREKGVRTEAENTTPSPWNKFMVMALAYSNNTGNYHNQYYHY